jgi:hypothetical protein
MIVLPLSTARLRRGAPEAQSGHRAGEADLDLVQEFSLPGPARTCRTGLSGIGTWVPRRVGFRTWVTVPPLEACDPRSSGGCWWSAHDVGGGTRRSWRSWRSRAGVPVVDVALRFGGPGRRRTDRWTATRRGPGGPGGPVQAAEVVPVGGLGRGGGAGCEMRRAHRRGIPGGSVPCWPSGRVRRRCVQAVQQLMGTPDARTR